jgi:ADP-ribosyl-[dinitrogen reductase] hydrolase
MKHMTEPKTSETDPIRVDFLPVQVVGLPGRIGMTFAPGKKARGEAGMWERSLQADLERLRFVFRASMLVSLIEPAERVAFGIADLPEQTAAMGLEFVACPMPDGGTPTSVAELDAVVQTILGAAADRRNVVIHCRGGLGRSGLVAAACLVAMGRSVSDAMALTRAARPRAIENTGQERFLATYAKERASARSQIETPVITVPLSRFTGCLLGGAIGDALGYPIEFDPSWQHIVEVHGASAPRSLTYANTPALISDDTQMTLFTAEGLIRAIHRGIDRGGCNIANVVQHALNRWYLTQGADPRARRPEQPGWLMSERRLHARRGPGSTNLSALRAQAREWHLPTVESPPNDSKGCGAIMRSAPIGLAAALREEAFTVARDAAVVTHGHPSGYLSAAYFASVVHDVARGASLADGMDAGEALLTQEQGHEETLRAIGAAKALARSGPPEPAAVETLGGGWTGEEALSIALACALTADASTREGFAAALWRSVAHGGDSDSTGSITGNLLGAMHGDAVLPEVWLSEVELRDVTDRLAKDLHAAAILETELDFESYPPN